MYYQPPYNFDCQHKNECPHLMGLSTHWVFSEYSRAQEQYQEFLHIRDNFRHDFDDAYRRINKLKKEIDELKAKFKTLHTRQFKKNIKRNTTAPKKRSRGAPK